MVLDARLSEQRRSEGRGAACRSGRSSAGLKGRMMSNSTTRVRRRRFIEREDTDVSEIIGGDIETDKGT